ncbi:Protein CBG26737 [Caenorhabditis briggsae]|uniref:Protein CBG26737 n=2 Tax=Caenorhabditis briggsae TaxID=6238 RepID=B6IEB2_CAEBR|nr:Protein CBG26737 [Caenorhabditis briggsae]CAS01176.1 Protein CBG26737 [Caenorhabditis briggsae]
MMTIKRYIRLKIYWVLTEVTLLFSLFATMATPNTAVLQRVFKLVSRLRAARKLNLTFEELLEMDISQDVCSYFNIKDLVEPYLHNIDLKTKADRLLKKMEKASPAGPTRKRPFTENEGIEFGRKKTSPTLTAPKQRAPIAIAVRSNSRIPMKPINGNSIQMNRYEEDRRRKILKIQQMKQVGEEKRMENLNVFKMARL